eukprot:scaffold261270_cov23-Tisochrysis_lutea.AAC.1
MRMVDNRHLPFGGWDGVVHKAKLKSAARLSTERAAAAAALDGRAGCPLRRPAQRAWRYNGSAYAGQIRQALEPWHAGGLTATALDMVFWHEMYPPQNKAEQPSLQLSVRDDGLRYVWQTADVQPGGAPPPGSADAALLTMVARVAQLVSLPHVELVVHTATLPKIFKQNPEPVLSPVTDEAHADIAAPSTWTWEAATAAKRAAPCAEAEGRLSQLLIPTTCEGPTDGFRGPLWRWYPAHLAAVLAARHPRLLHAVLRKACTGPPLAGGGMPVLEAAWDRLANESLAAAISEEARAAAARWRARRPGVGEVPVGVSAEPVAEVCAYRWLLLLDGTGPPRELLARMRQGFTIFKPDSPYREHFYARMAPWVHYVPVTENLSDLPARVRWAASHPKEAAAIARRGRALADSVNELEIACYWWQLLTAIAPLQVHEARGGDFGRAYAT